LAPRRRSTAGRHRSDRRWFSFVQAVAREGEDIGGRHRGAAALLLLQLAAIIVIVALAATRMKDSKILREERLAWGLALALTLTLSHHYWVGPADLRALSDIYLLSGMLLLAPSQTPSPSPFLRRLADRRLLLVAAPAVVTYGATFLARIIAL
jgi:hypothetical protein